MNVILIDEISFFISQRELHKTGKSFAQCSNDPNVNKEIVRLEGPSRLVDDAMLPAANGAAGNDQLKAAVTDLIERSLPVTLQGLRLADPS